MTYTWDANKRKTQEDNLLYAAHTNNYTGYDDEDRLTGWQRDGVGDSQSWSLSKVGDWNTTTVNGVTETRTHNAVHEILTATPPVPAAQLVHDVKGNLTTNKNGQVYTWDVENRLATATVPVAPPGVPLVHSYAYDALGRRVSKTVNNVTTTYINNADWQEVAEYQGETLIQSYVFGSYIDEVLCMVKANNSRFYYSTNDLYSVYCLSDSNGNPVERYMYDPYGRVTVLDGNGTPRTVNESLYGNPWTFTGRRLDQETGLMYFRNRMYETGLGRFVSRDPKGYVDGYGLQGAYFVPGSVDSLGMMEDGPPRPKPPTPVNPTPVNPSPPATTPPPAQPTWPWPPSKKGILSAGGVVDRDKLAKWLIQFIVLKYFNQQTPPTGCTFTVITGPELPREQVTWTLPGGPTPVTMIIIPFEVQWDCPPPRCSGSRSGKEHLFF